jgi:hypothetical protein
VISPDLCVCGHDKKHHRHQVLSCQLLHCPCDGFFSEAANPVDMPATLRRCINALGVRPESRTGRSLEAGAKALEDSQALKERVLKAIRECGNYDANSLYYEAAEAAFDGKPLPWEEGS